MDRTESLTTASAPAPHTTGTYIDWAAILAGAVIAAATAALSVAFAAGIGLSAISAEPGQGSITLAMVLGAVWMVVSTVASFTLGGYVAGRMRRRVDQATADEVSVRDGFNGLAVWAVALLITGMAWTNATGALVSAAGSAAGTAVSAAGSAVGGVAQGVLSATGAMIPENAGNAAMSFVNDTLLRTDPAAPAPIEAETADATTDIARQTAGILGNFLTTGEISDADRAYLESAVATSTGLPPAEVTARIDAAIASVEATRADAEATMQETEAMAIDVAETARITAVLTAFLLTAAALVAGAGAVGAAVRGGLHRDEGRAYAGLTYRRNSA